MSSGIEQNIKDLQLEIYNKQQELHKLVKERKPEEIKDYSFQQKDGSIVKLSELFGNKDELLLIHNMGKSCVYCTMWADGMRGYNDMINDRMAFVLTSPDDSKTMEQFARKRDWNFNYVSYNGSAFAHDMGFAEDKEGRTWYSPGFSALIKKDGKIYRTGKDNFGPGDYYCPPWHLFEFFPKGPNKWEPKYSY